MPLCSYQAAGNQDGDDVGLVDATIKIAGAQAAVIDVFENRGWMYVHTGSLSLHQKEEI